MEAIKNNYLYNGLPNEIRGLKQWACFKVIVKGKRKRIVAWDPIKNQEIKGNDLSNLVSLEQAIKLRGEYSDGVDGIGFVPTQNDAYVGIIIKDVGDKDREKSNLLSDVLDLFQGYIYAEFNDGMLNAVIKTDKKDGLISKDENLAYIEEKAIIPLHGNPIKKPKTTLSISKGISWFKRMYLETRNEEKMGNKGNSIPEYYVEKNGELKLKPDRLASKIIEDENLAYANDTVYRREKGGVFKMMEKKDRQKMIKDYLIKGEARYNQIKEVDSLIVPDIETDEGILDTNRIKGKINFQNGVYNLDVGTLSEYPETYRTAIQLNVAYNSEQDCPKFKNFLEEVLEPEDILTIQELSGYLLTAETQAQKAFVLVGPGQSGKSTYISMMEEIIGLDLVSNVSFQNLSDKFYPAELKGKLLNTFSDLPQKDIGDTGMFKSLVAGDSTSVNKKYKNPFTLNNTARFLFSCNKIPANYVDTSTGFYRRLVFIPFNKPVSNLKINRNLKEELLEEKEGIVQWALLGLQRLINNGYSFTESANSKKLMKEYMKRNNSTLWFCDEHCELDIASNVSGKRLYDEYKKACLAAKVRSVSQREFYSQVESLFEDDGVSKHQGSQTRAVEFVGIKLK
ncbi:phage/plasmid primase, P4 family [Niallia sp. HCP3S3_B10]|uniref:DNA primase family protein n=1 Tax=Niallia sp. HCP3S3_B10 TaxID=3438944 RepID=UPI003F8AAE60